MFFQSWRKGISEISKEMEELGKKFEKPGLSFNENSGLTQALEFQKDVNSEKSDVKKNLNEWKIMNTRQEQYLTEAASLVDEMEDKISDIQTELKKYGFKHVDAPKSQIDSEDKLTNGSQTSLMLNGNSQSKGLDINRTPEFRIYTNSKISKSVYSECNPIQGIINSVQYSQPDENTTEKISNSSTPQMPPRKIKLHTFPVELEFST